MARTTRSGKSYTGEQHGNHARDESEAWDYEATGDVDIRAERFGARIKSEEIDVSLHAPSANEVTVTTTLNVPEEGDIAGSIIELTADEAARLGRDLVLSAAGAMEESMNRRAGDALLEQYIAELQAELEKEEGNE